MKKLLTILLALVLLISASGCAEEEKAPAPIGSEVWETMPQLSYGVMEYEKLQILPWNSGRCEATSFYRMAETETGLVTVASPQASARISSSQLSVAPLT